MRPAPVLALPLALLALVVLVVLRVTGDDDGEASEPVTVAGPRAEDLPARAAAVCGALLDALPDTLEDQARRPLADPDVLGAAWGDPAIVLRCGTGRPEGFRRASECVVVDRVAWFFPGSDLVDPEGPEVVFSAVKRAVGVEVTRAASYGPPAEVLADLSGPVADTVPARGRCV